MISLENRWMKVTVMPDQGADIYELRYKPLDLDVLWRAPQELLPPGRIIPPVYREQGNFLDYLHGGWQEVLPNGHLNCVYKGAALGQHGEVSVLPWNVTILEDSPERVSVRFSVRTRRTPFYLERIMTLHKDEAVLTFDETVTNEGKEEMHFMWGHHPTFGAPFVREGCRLILPDGSKVHIPAFNTGQFRRYLPGTSSEWPIVPGSDGNPVRADFIPSMRACTDDSFYMEVPEGKFEFHNPELGFSLKMVWDEKVFPYVWCWQVYGGAYEYPYYGRTYNVAVEPFTSPIATLQECAVQGTAPILSPEQSLTTRLQLIMERQG